VDSPKGAKMRQELFMARRKRRNSTPEFKAEAVRLTRVGDQSIGQVAVDLELTETNLRDWVKRADADAGQGPPETLTSAVREELTRLRRENKRRTAGAMPPLADRKP
jgi:transposase-like protein